MYILLSLCSFYIYGPSQYGVDTSHRLNGRMWLLATMLDNVVLECDAFKYFKWYQAEYHECEDI